jgi:serine/threonine protein kinase, bacterial
VLDSGSTLGEFQILETLGSGAMGQVYRAQGPGDEVVAIKVISSALAGDESACQRFASESAILGDLRQPRIVAARTGLEREGEILYYAMEWVEGTDLAALLEQQGKLGRSEALSAVADVLEALSYAHARDVLHRDVKASNVLVDPSGRMKLSDFGLARALDETRVTRPGSVLGTPAYMAPELAEGGEASVETEIYAVGILLHELLAGSPPFRGESALAVLNQHVNATPPPLAGVDAPVQAIVAKALAKRPQERYGSATEMRDAVLLARGSAAPLSASPLGKPAAPSPQQALAAAETRELGGVTPAKVPPAKAEPGSDPKGPAAFNTTLVSPGASSEPGPPEQEPQLPERPDSRGSVPWLPLIAVLGLIVLGLAASSALRPTPPTTPSPTRPASPQTQATETPAESAPPEGTPQRSAISTPAPAASQGASPALPLVEVTLHSGETFRAELVGVDVKGDRLLTRPPGSQGPPRSDPLWEVRSYQRVD